MGQSRRWSQFIQGWNCMWTLMPLENKPRLKRKWVTVISKVRLLSVQTSPHSLQELWSSEECKPFPHACPRFTPFGSVQHLDSILGQFSSFKPIHRVNEMVVEGWNQIVNTGSCRATISFLKWFQEHWRLRLSSITDPSCMCEFGLSVWNCTKVVSQVCGAQSCSWKKKRTEEKATDSKRPEHWVFARAPLAL